MGLGEGGGEGGGGGLGKGRGVESTGTQRWSIPYPAGVGGNGGKKVREWPGGGGAADVGNVERRRGGGLGLIVGRRGGDGRGKEESSGAEWGKKEGVRWRLGVIQARGA